MPHLIRPVLKEVKTKVREAYEIDFRNSSSFLKGGAQLVSCSHPRLNKFGLHKIHDNSNKTFSPHGLLGEDFGQEQNPLGF